MDQAPENTTLDVSQQPFGPGSTSSLQKLSKWLQALPVALKLLTTVIAALTALVAAVKGLALEASPAPPPAHELKFTPAGTVNIGENRPSECVDKLWKLCNQFGCAEDGDTKLPYSCCGNCAVTAKGEFRMRPDETQIWATQNAFVHTMVDYANNETRGNSSNHLMYANGRVKWSDREDSWMNWRVTCDARTKEICSHSRP